MGSEEIWERIKLFFCIRETKKTLEEKEITKARIEEELHRHLFSEVYPIFLLNLFWKIKISSF